MNSVRTIFACVLLIVTAATQAATVRDFVRIRGQGESVIQGVGLVLGLNGTGDGGDEMATIRPLAELLRRNEMPVASLEELANAKSAALVMVTCVVPREGAKPDDTFDARISVVNSASSLKVGELYIAPLNEPRPGGSVYAFAQGMVTIEDEENPTTGVVARGVRMVRSIQTTPPIEGVFDLVLDNWYAGWTSAHYVSSQINDTYHLDTNPSVERIARVVDDRTIRLVVPPEERETYAAFISDVMQTLIDPKQFGLPAMVIANTKTGSIVVTGNVQISPAVITHDDLVLTTTLPPPIPTPEQPLVESDRWAPVKTAANQQEMARLDDLLAAFKQLDVDPSKQIQMLRDLHRSGSLHAKLIIDGSEG
ncbi:MAG: flagellar basal body P-ring protein FlgI [Phycisphaerales bacterium]|nr:flagellar basal body P-ring protein FlgI [Phycisphaerales bacterium]